MADEALSAGAVARRLGVAVTTLRTWHQRYGLGPSSHVPGHHRRYTPEDLARLEIMRRLTTEGVAPAEAARWARHAPDVPPATGADGAPPRPQRSGGGFAIPVGRAGPAARGLARAADTPGRPRRCATSSRARSPSTGVVSTWDDVVRPVLAGIGERHAATKRLIEVEHLFSRTTTEVLASVPRPRDGVTAPRILLACADEEQHSLPLEAMAAALAEEGVTSPAARRPGAGRRAAPTRSNGPARRWSWCGRSRPPPATPTSCARCCRVPADRCWSSPAARAGAPTTLPEGVTQPASLTEAVRLASGV